MLRHYALPVTDIPSLEDVVQLAWTVPHVFVRWVAVSRRNAFLRKFEPESGRLHPRISTQTHAPGITVLFTGTHAHRDFSFPRTCPM